MSQLGYGYVLVFLGVGIIFLILALLVDVEMAFLYPWALAVRKPGLGLIAVIDMVVFVAILAVGLVYAWRKGALEWE